MATREVNNMARELERIHKTLPEYKTGREENASNILPENRIWYYKKLVWDGLQKTDAYQKISAEDKKKMQTIYNEVGYLWSREWR